MAQAYLPHQLAVIICSSNRVIVVLFRNSTSIPPRWQRAD